MIFTIILNKNWTEIDVDALAKITFDAMQASVFRSNRTIDQILRWLNWNNNNFPPTGGIFLAYLNDELVGWLALTVNVKVEGFAEMWRWVPFISPEVGEQKIEIASQLIKEAVNFAKNEYKQKGIVICFDNLVEEDRQILYNRHHKVWFESQNFLLQDDTVYLQKRLSSDEYNNIELPKGYRFESIGNVNKESLYKCYNSSFSESQVRLFQNMSDEQKKGEFEYYFFKENVNIKATLILLKDEDVIGFSIVHSRPNEAHLAELGILKEYRGKGMGKMLMKSSMIKAALAGFEIMTISVDIINEPAYNLYLKMGFEIINRFITHAWKE